MSMSPRLAAFEEKSFSVFDVVLIVASAVALILSFFFKLAWADTVLAILSFIGLMPVVFSAFEAILKKRLSVDLLAAIALTFSLFEHQWTSAAFITLMLAFARLFDRITEARAKKIIQSLMKFHVEKVRIQEGDTIKEIHVSQVRKGDLVIVESGDRMPIDGTVISGTAEVDESSLTGESELVPKKAGDLVSTATVNESGSLIVKAEKVGADTTLSKIITLIDSASRDKNQAERSADRFTQWYILLTLVAAIVMYLLGLTPKIILSVLLVVCADDIAVAVPLAFTAAITRAAKRGVIVKGSTAFEQMGKMKYMLTDKTGTLTKGKPKVVDVKAYGAWTPEKIIELSASGASESRHMVSRAILEYAAEKKAKLHAPKDVSEKPGYGITFTHGDQKIFSGRLSFIEEEGITISAAVKKDYETEKDAGRGISVVAARPISKSDSNGANDSHYSHGNVSESNGPHGEVIGIISYEDELRPHVKEIIEETKRLGVREWHMLTGDTEKAAAAVAAKIGIRHFHANMTPAGKVEFIRKFERERRKHETVGYIGDGVNDAASLALADVSIAMGGIGADAAIEAADITIMKDQLDRVPEIMEIGRSARRIMLQNFGIWAVTNGVGLALVCFGFIGPVGAATYNFLTDFIPIGNALRAGRRKG